MIKIIRKEDCCGCNACYNACPISCIEIRFDEFGFAYPVVKEELCIQCGKCVSVCPIQNNAVTNKPLRVLGTKNKNENIRKTSSSGGTFYGLARQVVEKGGIVYGCALNADMVACHIGIETVLDLEKLKSSKYVQSEIGDTYKQVKQNLITGREVLFSGTPCQVAGLKNYLGKQFDNLLLVDVLCHGAPSPKMFADYLDYLAEKYKGKPISVDFRQKQKGWKRLYFEVVFDNGKRYFTFCGYDRYMAMFLNNISLRPSCYYCKFACEERQGDISLGDFWGIGRKYPQRDDDKGISLVLINTEKGELSYSAIAESFYAFDSDLETAKAGQRTLSIPTQKNPKHEEFYRLYADKGIKEAVEQTVKVPNALKRAYYAVMRWALDVMRKIFKKGY